MYCNFQSSNYLGMCGSGGMSGGPESPPPPWNFQRQKITINFRFYKIKTLTVNFRFCEKVRPSCNKKNYGFPPACAVDFLKFLFKSS